MDTFFLIYPPGELWQSLPVTFVSSFKPKVSTSSVGTFPKRVKIVEVGPRDGLQNEKVKMEINRKSFYRYWEFHVMGTELYPTLRPSGRPGKHLRLFSPKCCDPGSTSRPCGAGWMVSAAGVWRTGEGVPEPAMTHQGICPKEVMKVTCKDLTWGCPLQPWCNSRTVANNQCVQYEEN